MTLGERIKRYRQMQGLSQEELAEKINVSRQAITKWENDNLAETSNLLIGVVLQSWPLSRSFA